MYGITEDEMPTPIAAPSSVRSVNAGRASPMPNGKRDHGRDQHRRGEPVDAGRAAAAGDAMAEHDVGTNSAQLAKANR